MRRDQAARGEREQVASDAEVRDILANIEVLAQAAEAKGLDKRPDVQALLALQRKEVLVRLVQDDFLGSHVIDDARVRAEYDKAKAEAGGNEYLARHILVDDETLARDLSARLGAKDAPPFEELARQHSRDSSAEDGGSLGWLVPGNVVPEFAQALVALEKGAYTTLPVRSPFGWHIILLEDKRALEFPDYDRVKAEIARQLMQQDFRRHVEALRRAARVEVPAP
ncbi:MAG: peptidylprolyl isomerase [Thiobacillaceae bacterium]|nr:peptidylprolyl isomerase [Thiobacillaceae bacterium]